MAAVSVSIMAFGSDWTFVWDWLAYTRSFLNSSFVSSVIGALAGAFFGALAATRFADKKERERLKLHDLRKNNSSVVLATSIANHSLTFKKQVVRGIVDKFEADLARYKAFLEESKVGRVSEKFEIEYDYRDITFFKHEADELRALLVSELSADPKITMAAVQLWQSLHSLEKSIDQRAIELQRLIDLKGKLSNDEYARRYFGLPTDSGNIDQRYSDTIYTIRNVLDNAIFFSTYIAEKLSERGVDLCKTLGRKADRPVTSSFSNLDDPSLLPNRNEFSDWT